PLAPASEPLQQLMNAANKILNEFAQNATFDPAALFEVVKGAESFSASLKKNVDCGLVDNPATYSTAITGIVQQLLKVAFFGPPPPNLDVAHLTALIYAGIETGAIGDGATDQKTSKEILAGAELVFEGLLKEAIKGGFKSWMEEIHAVAIAV